MFVHKDSPIGMLDGKNHYYVSITSKNNILAADLCQACGLGGQGLGKE
jgi:hypothetical protein